VTRRWRELYPRRKATTAAIERHLARYGRYKGLAFWLHCTRRWHETDEWRV
jgi:hypothetical protein